MHLCGRECGCLHVSMLVSVGLSVSRLHELLDPYVCSMAACKSLRVALHSCHMCMFMFVRVCLFAPLSIFCRCLTNLVVWCNNLSQIQIILHVCKMGTMLDVLGGGP